MGQSTQVNVRIRDIDLAEALRIYIVRRLRFALSRFGARVGSVVVRISDVNGERGGIDQCCHISAALPPSHSVIVEELDADLYAAIDRASERLGRAFGREVERQRHLRTRRESVRTGNSGARRKRDSRNRLDTEISNVMGGL
jgi:ribosome hibernation promoting factor